MPRRPLHRRSIVVGVLALVISSLVGCTSGTRLGSSGTVDLTTGVRTGTARPTAPATSVIPTPVTVNGLLTGPGVTDTTIALGLLVDPATDRGFATGVALWQRGVNLAGGLCGRTISLQRNTTGESLTAGYNRIAGTTVGLITLPTPAQADELAARSGADQIPTLTLGGSSTALTRTGPVVIGATEDIKAINALAYLRSTGKLPKGSVLGTLTDSSAEAVNALDGARWWAGANGVTLVSESSAAGTTPRWTGVRAVLVIAGPDEVRDTLAGTASDVEVVTNLDGYDPARTAGSANRLLIALAAPAYGSDNPGAAAVARAFVGSGRTDPGPNLIAGYGVAATWGRLLVQACVTRTLTHAGIQAALTAVGPASVESLFGPADPGIVVRSALPATRVSSMAQADPAAAAGLRPLTWLQAAPGIADYDPGR